RQLRHAAHRGQVGDRHDAGDHRLVDVAGRDVVDQAEIVVDAEEELRDGEVGQVQLGGQMVAVRLTVGRARVELGVGGDADREAADGPGQLDELDGVVQLGKTRFRFGRGIATEGEHVLHAGLAVRDQDLGQL